LVADNVNLYYYVLQDVQYGNPVPSFGIKPGGDLQAVSPLFDLSCPASSVSIVFPLILSSALSPLLVLVLYNLSIAKSVLQYVLPAALWRCDCPCIRTSRSLVHTSAWATRPMFFYARANGHAKPSSTLSSSTTLRRSSNIGVPTGTGVVTSEEVVGEYHRDSYTNEQ
jgi:hypothetical protein